MAPVLAHGSGWDEIALFFAMPALWGAFVLIGRLVARRRARAGGDATVDPGAGTPPSPPRG